jgi:uncharacterized membrane protein YfcA
MLGLGGAIIYTPLFFWIGFPLLSAIPMALLLNVITTSSASINYLKQNLVDKKVAFPMILFSIAGAFFGSYLAHIIETRYIIILLSIVLLIAAFRMLFFNNISWSLGMVDKKKMIAAGCAFFIGSISSLVGIGGGTFIVPLLLVLGYKIKNAVATSAFIITFMSLSGFLGYLSFGFKSLDLKLIFYAGMGAFIGAQIGSKLIFKHISSIAINRIFAIILFLITGKLLYGLI